MMKVLSLEQEGMLSLPLLICTRTARGTWE
jgi:hypothetical protein